MDENIRFTQLLDELKKRCEIVDYVQAASILQTNKSGISDIKSGRKKLSIEMLQRMKISFPTINLEWLVMGTGTPFLEAGGIDSKTDIKKTSEGEQSIGIVSQFLTAFSAKDNEIRELAEEIGRLRERNKQLEQELRGVALDATNEGAAHVG